MKLSFFLLFFAFLFQINSSAQKIGFYDSDSVLPKMPQFIEAKINLEKAAKDFETQINNELQQLAHAMENLMYKKPLMPEAEFEAAMNRIFQSQTAIEEKKNRFFGYRGELFQLKMKFSQSYTKPFQEAVDKVCKKQKLHFLIDRSADLLLIYGEPAFNYTRHLLSALGLNPKTSKNSKTGKKDKEKNDSKSDEKPADATDADRQDDVKDDK